MYLSCRVANGRPTFLAYNVGVSGNVLYLNNEMDELSVQNRFRKMTSVAGDEMTLERVYMPRRQPVLGRESGELTEICRDIQPVLIVIDSFYNSHSNKENDNAAMKCVVKHLVEMRNAYNCCVLALHHTKKGSRGQRMHNDLMRGAGVFAQAADSVLMMRRSDEDENKRIFKATKLRHSSDSHRVPRLLGLDEQSFIFQDLGEINEDDHVRAVALNQAATRHDFRSIFADAAVLQREQLLESMRGPRETVSDRTLDRVLRRAVGNGQLVSTRRGEYSLPKPLDTVSDN
jgi:hypothetical protein